MSPRRFDPRDGRIYRQDDPPAPPTPEPTRGPTKLSGPKPGPSAMKLQSGLPAFVTQPDGTTDWNPDLFADHSDRIGLHEAAHATAAYLFGHAVAGIKVRPRAGQTLTARSGDVFEASVVALAGEAFERSIGLGFTGGRSDLNKVTELLSRTLSGAALDEACRVVSEAALEPASSERFNKLAFALANRIANESVLTSREILETLRAADPERRVEAHSQSGPVVAPWYKVFADNSKTARLLYEGSDEAEAFRIQRLHPHSMKIGSIYS